MESSRTCSTCSGTNDDPNDNDYTQSEQTQSYYGPMQSHSNYSTVFIPTTYQLPQQYYAQPQHQQQFKSPYTPYGCDNYAYGSHAHLPNYNSQFSSMNQQQTLPAYRNTSHNMPAVYPLRYIMPPMGAHNLYYQHQYQYPRREIPRHIIQYVECISKESDEPVSKNVQHQMCQTSSTATSLFNSDNQLSYGYNCSNAVEIESYELDQQQQMKKNNSVGSDLRFINMINSVGASANIPNDDENDTSSNTEYNQANKANNFAKSNVITEKNPKRAKVSIGGIVAIAIVLAAVVLATVLGIVLTKDDHNPIKMTANSKSGLFELNFTTNNTMNNDQTALTSTKISTDNNGTVFSNSTHRGPLIDFNMRILAMHTTNTNTESTTSKQSTVTSPLNTSTSAITTKITQPEVETNTPRPMFIPIVQRLLKTIQNHNLIE